VPAPAVVPALVVVAVDVDAVEVLLLTLPAVPALLKVEALPSSMNSTVAPLLLIPMKLPTRGVAPPEVAAPLDMLAVLVCAFEASGPVPGALKLPDQPCVPSVSL